MLLVGFSSFSAAHDLGDAVAAVVVDDFIEPGLKLGAAFELVDLVEDLDEGILGDFLGVLAGTENTLAGIKNEAFVSAEKFAVVGEIVREFFLTFFHELSVVEFVETDNATGSEFAESFNHGWIVY